MIAPTVTGFAVEYGGGYRGSFLLTGAVGLAGVAVIFFLVPGGQRAPAGPIKNLRAAAG
jgi:predicted MFS family arabinose efflux permease